MWPAPLLRHRTFTMARQDQLMQNNTHSPSNTPEVHLGDAPQVDAKRILETIVTELELLTVESPLAARSDLIDLHAALLVFELGGHIGLVPNVGFAFNGRRLLEARVARAARRIIGSNDADSAVTVAAETVEELIHLIDPELRLIAA